MDRSAPPPLVALDRVNVHLDGRHVLHDVSWRLERGEQWAIVGANGSGKSTLLRVIRGDCWIDRDGGMRTYALDGVAEPVARAAPRIGYVSPELHERYVRLALPFDGRTLIASGLHDAIYLPRGVERAEAERVEALARRLDIVTLLERPIGALSFGELRVLLVARALVREPRVLVLDECANGLDRRMRARLLDVLQRAASATHVIAATHRADDVPATTTMHAVLDGGRIVSAGAGPPPRLARTAASPQSAAPARGRDELVAIRDADVYRGERRILRDVAWTLHRGEHCVVRGRNGAGKSTFAGLVAGTVPAALGADVRRFGKSGPFDVWELKRRIAHVSDALQIAYDVNPIVERVIASGFVASIGVLHEPDAAQRSAVHDVMRALRLQHLAGRRFLGLSFGERRKVLIARGLVHQPDLLILDEIWGGLDAEFRATLGAQLDRLVRGGTTVMLISHHDDDVPHFVRRACTIERGRVLEAS